MPPQTKISREGRCSARNFVHVEHVGRCQALTDPNGDDLMATVTTKVGTEIVYKDWGRKDAQPIGGTYE